MNTLTAQQKEGRYQRILAQLDELFAVTSDPISNMATAAAILYHKMGHFYWIGFYRLIGEQLLVGPYQGTLACQLLAKDAGVCRAAIRRNETILVPDVHQFEGHIACDPRSQSEIVVPIRNRDGKPCAVLDADSDKLGTFDEIDATYLELVAQRIRFTA